MKRTTSQNRMRLVQASQRSEVRTPKWRAIALELRPHHWGKNLLVFLPALARHRFSDFEMWKNSLLVFISFSLVASSVYVMNDFFDLESDKRNFSKRKRPLASGALTRVDGYALLAMTAAGAFGLTLLLPSGVALVLAAYLGLNVLYSWFLKKMPIADVVIVAGFYVARIEAGSQGTGILISQWLLTFSIFFFFSLACLKRFTELKKMDDDQADANRRGYRTLDSSAVFGLGVASAITAVQIIVHYLHTAQVEALYRHPNRLWFLIPLALYWIARAWLIGNRGEMNQDPVVFALGDLVSWVIGGSCFLIFYLAL